MHFSTYLGLDYGSRRGQLSVAHYHLMGLDDVDRKVPQIYDYEVFQESFERDLVYKASKFCFFGGHNAMLKT